MTESKTTSTFLGFFPVSLFGSVMSLAGLSFAWASAERAWGLDTRIKDFIGMTAILLFMVLTIIYLAKCLKYPALVKAEFEHPVSVSFFATWIISVLLLPGLILPYSQAIGIGMWIVGTVGMAAFSWFVFRKWLSHQQDPANAMPAWVLPIVGTLDIPVVGYRLSLPGIHEINLLFFGIGVVFALMLITIIISRLLFHPPLPEALQPTLMILVGPFALATSGYDSLTGGHDILLSVFFYFDIALFALLGSRIMLLPRCCPFRVTWWSVSFPLVALTIASFHYATHVPSNLFLLIPGALLVLSTGVILYLLVQTGYKLITHQLFLASPGAEKATRTLAPPINPV